MFRSYFLTFFGTPRNMEKYHHAHESPSLILIPLVVLSLVSFVLGFFFHYENNIAKFLSWGEHGEAEVGGHHAVLAMSLFALIGGFALSWIIYMSKRPLYEILGKKLAAVHAILTQRYKFDELYLWVIKRVYYPVMNFSAWFDFNIWDQTFVDGVGRIGKGFSWISNIFDGRLVDGVFIDGWGILTDKAGTGLRKLQSGLAQSYLFWMGIGLASMFVWIAYTFK
jgi:NADH-quinone oxidoreductase subunit L